MTQPSKVLRVVSAPASGVPFLTLKVEPDEILLVGHGFENLDQITGTLVDVVNSLVSTGQVAASPGKPTHMRDD